MAGMVGEGRKDNAVIRLAVPCKNVPPVLGMGAFLKSTLCLIQNGEACLSQDIGSLDNIAAEEAYRKKAEVFLTSSPVRVAHDLHPDFFSTRYAQGLGIQAFPVQHHHAHIAAVMAEYGEKGPVLGMAFDGFGLGLNGGLWGGELLRVDAKGFQRLGYLRPMPQPGGDVAAREPWRMGAAALWALGRGGEIASRYKDFPQAPALAMLLQRGFNCPLTSSAGRLFDAACGLLGIKLVSTFEGEAPMALEALADAPQAHSGGWAITEKSGQYILDLRPVLEQLIGKSAVEGANLFHGTLIAAVAAWIEKAAAQSGMRKVAFGGGCFFNKVLREGLAVRMEAAKMTCLWPVAVSAGDAAISLGQAYAAALALEAGEK